MVIQLRPEPDNVVKTILDESKSLFCMQGIRANITGWNFVGLELPIGQTQYWEREKSLVIILKRQWKFYLYRVVLVLFIIGLITLSVFIFGEDSIADRFGFISTTLLTVVAYMFIIKEYLPQLNYLTLLDLYIYFILGYIGLVAVECVIVELLEDEIDTSLDFIFFISDLVFFAVIHIIFVIYAVKRNNVEWAEVRQAKFSLDDNQAYYEVSPANHDHSVSYTKEGKEKESKSYFAYSLSEENNGNMSGD